MTPGQLVKAVAIALDVPEETVVQHDRNLAVAGLRTSGARGRNAPNVTPLDAARLFVATFASTRIKDSVDTVRAFEKTKFTAPMSDADLLALFKESGTVREDMEREMHSTEKFADVAVMGLPPEHNFVQAIASLIGDASGPIPDHEQYLQRFAPLIIRCGLPWAEASIGHMVVRGGSARYEKPLKVSSNKSGPKWDEIPSHARYAARYGITQRRDTTGTALMLLGRAFRENGLNFASTKEALADFLKSAQRESKKPVA